MGWFARFARGVRSAKADGLMFASDRTQSHFRELRLGIGLRVTFAVPGGPGARVFRCPKTSSHALWPGSSVRTPLTGWRQPRRLLSSSHAKLLFEAGYHRYSLLPTR
jgi:hypothetical protein